MYFVFMKYLSTVNYIGEIQWIPLKMNLKINLNQSENLVIVKFACIFAHDD